MALINELTNYLKTPKQRQSKDIFWLPDTRAGVHLMELPLEVILRTGQEFELHINESVERLSHTNIEKTLYPMCEPTNLMSLIQAWDTAYFASSYQEFLLYKSILNSLPLKEEHFYTILYHDILRGNREKRSFRIHFKETYIPFVFSKDGQIKEINIELKSISSSGLLFSTSWQNFDLLKKAQSCGIAIFPNDLFRTRDKEVEKEIKEFKIFRPSWEVDLKRKMSTINVKVENIRFSQNHIQMVASHRKDNNVYFHITYECMEDIILLQKSYFGDIVKNKLASIEKDFSELCLAV